MTRCGRFSEQLVAFDREELQHEVREQVSRHVATCGACAAELEEIRAVLGLVRGAVEDPDEEETRRLLLVVDDALAVSHRGGVSAPRGRLLDLRNRVADGWEFAVWRYQRSSPLRRFVAASVVAHVAALLVVAVMLVGDHRRTEPTFVAEIPEAIAPLDEGDPGSDPAALLPPRPEFEGDELPEIRFPPFEAGSPEGYVPRPVEPDRTPAKISDLRFPTIRIALRYASLFDPEDRRRRLRTHAGAEAEKAAAAIRQGLSWLGEHREEGGTWAPATDAPAEVRAGVTSAALLAFLSDGRSAVAGDDARLLAPAVRWLDEWVTVGHRSVDVKRPLHGFSLAVRALTHHYFLDFRHLDADQRSERKRLLGDAGRRLLAWQSADGGFGYTKGADRTDSSCTLFAVAALHDLRLAGIMETEDALVRAARYLSVRRRRDGTQDYRLAKDRDGDLALTAAVLSLTDARKDPRSIGAIALVEAALAENSSADALFLWLATEALRRHRRSLARPMAVAVGAQRDDGSWPDATDRHCRAGGASLTTAMGVLTLTSVYVRPAN